MTHLNLFLRLRYVFHSAGILPDPSYQGRVEYFGQPGTKNCSLKISDLRQSDSGTYVFYLITDHPTEKMPDQSGIQLLVAGRGIFIYWTLNLFCGVYCSSFHFSSESHFPQKLDKNTYLFAPTWDLDLLKKSHAWHWQTTDFLPLFWLFFSLHAAETKLYQSLISNHSNSCHVAVTKERKQQNIHTLDTWHKDISSFTLSSRLFQRGHGCSRSIQAGHWRRDLTPGLLQLGSWSTGRLHLVQEHRCRFQTPRTGVEHQSGRFCWLRRLRLSGTEWRQGAELHGSEHRRGV